MAYDPPALPAGLAIRRVALDTLHLDPANAREHGLENMERSKRCSGHMSAFRRDGSWSGTYGPDIAGGDALEVDAGLTSVEVDGKRLGGISKKGSRGPVPLAPQTRGVGLASVCASSGSP
jgi:hypothetical protein